MAREQRNRLDGLLDDALKTYVSQEPRSGIEGRVLNRIRSESRRPRFLLFRWALPIAALGGLLVGVGIWKHRAEPEPSAPAEIAVTETSPPSAMVPSTVSAKPPSVKRRSAHRSRMPKQTRFPVRAPLTQQERALLAFIHSAPNEAWELFGETLPTKIDPLRIDEIELEPLQISDGAK